MQQQDLFCANCQQTQPHKLEVSNYSNETIATCTVCARFLKFAPGLSEEVIADLFLKHNIDNIPAEEKARLNSELAEETKKSLDGPAEVFETAKVPGERVQDNLTPAERAEWNKINKVK